MFRRSAQVEEYVCIGTTFRTWVWIPCTLDENNVSLVPMSNTYSAGDCDLVIKL